MANNRKAIRAALKEILAEGDTAADESVFTNRETKLWPVELPCIIIYTPDEEATPESISQTRYIRDLQLNIELKITATEDVDDDLDDFVAEVEALIDANPSLGVAGLSSKLTNTNIRIDEGGENQIGVATLSLLCKYIS